MISARPLMNSARLRHRLSSVYAKETRSGSRLFQPSSAIRTLTIAVSRVNGGIGAAIENLPCHSSTASIHRRGTQPQGPTSDASIARVAGSSREQERVAYVGEAGHVRDGALEAEAEA